MQIFVRSNAASTITLDVELSDSTENIKTKIQNKWGFSPLHQRLFYAGTQLQDGFTLGDYNVQHESTINLVVVTPTPTITYKQAVKLPGVLRLVTPVPVNDSGLGATDLDLQANNLKTRFIAVQNRLYAMHKNADGVAYFGTVRQSDIEAARGMPWTRYVNTNPDLSPDEVLFSVFGTGLRFNIVASNGQVQRRWTSGLGSARALSFGGNDTIIVTGSPNGTVFNGIKYRIASLDRNTQESSGFAVDTLEQTGKNIGEWMSQAYGADNNLHLFDYENRRILTYDTGVNGGTRGTLLNWFDLDPNRPAVNSMTMDLAGNFYIGDGAGGFEMYGRDGQWKTGFHATYEPDPDAQVYDFGSTAYAPTYMNYYASGLNDGNGTLDIRDATGYRQYSINVTPPLPTVSIGDAQILEGNSGSTALVFPVTLSASSTQSVNVNFATQNGTAIAGNGVPFDYTGRTGALTFAPGQTSRIVSVVVRGDLYAENDDTFGVTLSNPNNATLNRASAIGTILNDDGNTAPVVSVADASTPEGNSGTKSMVFTFTLDKPSESAITLNFATQNGTAIAGNASPADYSARSGVVTFAPNQTSRTVAISLYGNTLLENDENFALNLSNVSGATLASTSKTGTIQNDD